MSKKQFQKVPDSIIKITRKVGGFAVSATVDNGPDYQRVRRRLEEEIDLMVKPYQLPMNRHDAAMVCSTLSQKTQGFGVDLLSPFAVQ